MFCLFSASVAPTAFNIEASISDFLNVRLFFKTLKKKVISLSVIQDFAYDDPKLEFNVDAPNGLVMEGYLFKRASNAFKTWNRLAEKSKTCLRHCLSVFGVTSVLSFLRRWFSIQNSQLVYQKKLKASSD